MCVIDSEGVRRREVRGVCVCVCVKGAVVMVVIVGRLLCTFRRC